MKLQVTTEIRKLFIAVLPCVLFFIAQLSFAQTFTANNQGAYQSGTHDGFFYSFWSEGGGQASMTLGPKGNYSTSWTNVQNFTAGKGWRTGSRNKVICFEGTYNGGSNGFLAVYGWTTDPLIEYYVVENHGQWRPPGNTSDIESMGTVFSDGDTYDIYRSQRVNKPSIIGNATFYQFWSVRRTKRSSGTVTFANHVDAWEKTGLKLGSTWDYQIMESEGFGSSGNSNITVSECNACATAAPTVTAVVNYEKGDVAKQLTATGTSLKWYNVATGGNGSNTAPTPSTATTGTTVYYVSSTANGCESSRSAITVNVIETYKMYKTPLAPVIDGAEDALWQDANISAISATKVIVGTVSGASDLSGNVKLVWDNTNIYFYAVVTDDSKRNDSPNSYEDDAIELYFDINNDKATTYGANDVQYSFGWNDGTVVGALPSGRSVAGIVYSAVSTSNGYVVEGRIPWTTLQGSPQPNQLLGLDFMINDDDDGSGRDGKLSWNAATDDAWQNPSLFGTAKLLAEEIITSSGSRENFKVSIYPNPAKDILTVEGIDGAFNYSILDHTGRTIQTGSSSSNIQLQSIQKGLYIINVSQNNHNEILKIIVE
mgnify:CR=1 FL=1